MNRPETIILDLTNSQTNFSVQCKPISILKLASIPIAYFHHTTFACTVKDTEAVTYLQKTLGKSRVSPSGDTVRSILLYTNTNANTNANATSSTSEVSKYLVYGKQSLDKTLTIHARALNLSLLQGYTLPKPRPVNIDKIGVHKSGKKSDGQVDGIFLVARKRTLLDQVSETHKRRKTIGSFTLSRNSLSNPETVEVDHQRSKSPAPMLTVAHRLPTESRHISLPKLAIARPSKVKDAKEAEKTGEAKGGNGGKEERAAKEHIKRLAVTSLRLRGLEKTDAEFKAIYNQTIQAAAFAMRKMDYQVDGSGWEKKVFDVVEILVDLFR